MSEYVKEPIPAGAAWDFPELAHLDGVPWWEAPVPRRWHRCWAQTKGFVRLTRIDRCACGAMRDFFNHRPGRWWDRNSRDPKRERPIPDRPYIERKQEQLDQMAAIEARWAAASDSLQR